MACPVGVPTASASRGLAPGDRTFCARGAGIGSHCFEAWLCIKSSSPQVPKKTWAQWDFGNSTKKSQTPPWVLVSKCLQELVSIPWDFGQYHQPQSFAFNTFHFTYRGPFMQVQYRIFFFGGGFAEIWHLPPFFGGLFPNTC